MKRAVIILCHWATVIMVLLLTKGGATAEAIQWAFALVALGWSGIALTTGLAARPGPKLQGVFRSAFPWMHRGMYLVMAATAILTIGALQGWADMATARRAILILFVAGIFHGIFHMWRHTALNDGALRMMTPKIWHKYL